MLKAQRSDSPFVLMAVGFIYIICRQSRSYSRRPLMFRKLTVSAILGVLILVAASCAAEEKKEDEQPAAAAPDAAATPKEESPYYEVTKDDITSHADWTSMNVMLNGAKIGDKTTAVEKKLGKVEKTDLVGA